MHPYADDLFAPHIFAPPQEEIARILPHLVWPDRTLHVLGRRTHGQNTIYDLGDGRVVKTGRSTSFDEAKAMIIVRAHTNIPVPKVYMVFEHRGSTHIVMERIDGVALREAQKYNAKGQYAPESALASINGLRSIMQQLREIIEELRDFGRRFCLQEPRFGSWPGGPYRNSYFAADMPTVPFRTVSDFHGYWLKRLEQAYKDAETYEDLQQLQNNSVAHDSTPVLSHGDLAPRNILVKDDRIVGVVDWETFGWYPGSWEMMAVRNELMSQRLLEAQQDVFGHIIRGSEVDVYLRVCRCALV